MGSRLMTFDLIKQIRELVVVLELGSDLMRTEFEKDYVDS